MKEKSEYTCKKLLEKILKEYHSVIDIFMKQDADMLPEHQDKDHSIQLEEGKNPLFVQNYKLFSETGDYSTTQLPFNQWLKTVEFVAMKCLSTKTERGREKKISKIKIDFVSKQVLAWSVSQIC